MKLHYKGGKGFLTAEQRDEILFYLRMQPHYSVEALRDYLEYHDGVVYQSKQSYYALLDAAGLSWHQTQVANPKRDDVQVLRKREEIKKTNRPSSRNRLKSSFLNFLNKKFLTLRNQNGIWKFHNLYRSAIARVGQTCAAYPPLSTLTTAPLKRL